MPIPNPDPSSCLFPAVLNLLTQVRNAPALQIVNSNFSRGLRPKACLHVGRGARASVPRTPATGAHPTHPFQVNTVRHPGMFAGCGIMDGGKRPHQHGWRPAAGRASAAAHLVSSRAARFHAQGGVSLACVAQRDVGGSWVDVAAQRARRVDA
jgi:hypothetical protein